MARNLERFSTPKSIQQLKLKEGILDYEDERADGLKEKQKTDQEVGLEIIKKAKEIIDSFYIQGFFANHDSSSLAKLLSELPKVVRKEVFKQWLTRDQFQCLNYIESFGVLSLDLQGYIIEHANLSDPRSFWALEGILKIFDKVADPRLETLILQNGGIGFGTLIENRFKFSFDIRPKLLKILHHKKGEFNEWFDWTTLVKYIDQFPSINKIEVIEGVFRQTTNQNLGVLVEHRDKLDLSERQIIDLFYAHEEVHELTENLKHISPEYHQEIAEHAIEKGKLFSVILNASNFQNVDVSVLINKIAKSTTQKDGLDKVVDDIHYLPKFWIQQIPPEIKEKIITKLFEKGKVRSLIDFSEQLGITLDRAFAYRFIKQGKADNVIEFASSFVDLDLDPELALAIIENNQAAVVADHLPSFSGLDSDIALQLVKAKQGWAVITNINAFSGLDLNREFAIKIIESGQIDSLTDNIDKFSGINYEVEFSEQHYLSSVEGLWVLHKNPDLPNLPDEDKYRSIAELCAGLWNDEENISRPLDRGAEVFGYKRMFMYLSKNNLTRHDGLHAFSKIIDLYSVSGFSSDQFYGNILSQVTKDDASYDAGTAHHRLNEIALSLQGRNPAEILEEARGYASIQGLASLAEHFSSSATIFTSWRNLKQFAELTQLLGQRETLEKLKSYRESGKIKLAEFAEKLAFHPGGGVEMGAVMQFVENPESFLARKESHAPEPHELKKPSNYTEIPNLDLTAEELRDAYVEGALDQLQAFPPFEMGITIREKIHVRTATREALGSRKGNIVPLARDSKKLFTEIGKVLKEAEITLQDYLDGTDIPSETEAKIEILVYNKQFGMLRTRLKERIFRAKVNLKSDAEGVLAGNDTACCMPFGSGKNNVYMFNPITALFTLQMKRGDRYRTIAQSVLTKDRDIKVSIPQVIEKLKAESGNIGEVLPESILESSLAVVACDNVEVNPNYRDEGKEIESVYRVFFAEYFKRYAAELGVETDKVVIGQGYSDSLTHLPSMPNTFAPMAPMGYSDKTGENVYTLNMTIPSPMQAEIIGVSEAPVNNSHPERKSVSADTRIQPLTFEDSLPVAYLEGKAYRDNQSLMTYLHNMENGLIAKDINNTAKGRPNMSLKYVDEGGRTRAYLFAYEGKIDIKGNGEHEPVIYISDLASDKQTRLGGRNLIRAFTEIWRKEYIEKGNLIAVYTEAREVTSYRIITRQIERVARDLGMELKVEELGTYDKAGETMHRVVIRPVLK